MLAHLSLVLLLEGVELALVAIEVVVVRLLSEVSEDFAGWVVEVLFWLTVLTELTSVLALIRLDSSNNHRWRSRVEILFIVSLAVAIWGHRSALRGGIGRLRLEWALRDSLGLGWQASVLRNKSSFSVHWSNLKVKS